MISNGSRKAKKRLIMKNFAQNVTRKVKKVKTVRLSNTATFHNFIYSCIRNFTQKANPPKVTELLSFALFQQSNLYRLVGLSWYWCRGSHWTDLSCRVTSLGWAALVIPSFTPHSLANYQRLRQRDAIPFIHS